MKKTVLTPEPLSRRFAAIVLLAALQGCAHVASSAGPRDPLESLSVASRLDHIRRAQVWRATDVATMDLRAGPPGSLSLAPEQVVVCDYVLRKLGGTTPKFSCLRAGNDEVRVRYGADNGEVYASILGSRLFWALGFGADAFYPVRVTCRGCSEDPWKMPQGRAGEVTFQSSTIERKTPGDTLESREDQGWKWSELDTVEEGAGGAPLAQRDALKLLASLVEHIDSKGQQQRLICAPRAGVPEAPGHCEDPFLMVQDLGVTFGSGGLLSRHLNDVGAANFHTWAPQTVFRDPSGCVGSVSRTFEGSLNHPEISEAGRKFLSDLLEQLSDRQLQDLFSTARVDQRSRNPGSDEPPASVDDWTDAFKRKREEIKSRRCPEGTRS